jgi:hypothetical protein
VRVYRLELCDDVILALLASGRLTDEQALDAKKVEAALADVVAEWARRWVR